MKLSVSPEDGSLALKPESSADEVALACMVHALAKRGRIIVVPLMIKNIPNPEQDLATGFECLHQMTMEISEEASDLESVLPGSQTQAVNMIETAEDFYLSRRLTVRNEYEKRRLHNARHPPRFPSRSELGDATS